MNNGGPVFPLTVREPHGNYANDQHLPGLSLRDYFAAQALQGLLRPRRKDGSDG